MGILTKAILGGFNGTVGTVVGGSWRGINYIKSLPVISNTDPTPRQLEQRQKFKTVVNFLRPLMALIQLGFKNSGAKLTPYNAAMAYNYRHALAGTYPAFSIDYSFAVVTNGSLPAVLAPQTTAEPLSIVKFDWENNGGNSIATDGDKMILVVYCPEANQAVYSVGDKLRSDESATIDARQFAGKTVHTWISCATPDEKMLATSVYTGQLTVTQ